MPKLRVSFVWFCVLFFGLFYLVQNFNHRFWLNDFKVYYFAAQNLLGHKPLYGQIFGLSTGFYKYSPIALFFFVPFACLPFFLAATIYFAVVAFCMVLTMQKSVVVARSCVAGRTEVPPTNPTKILYLIFLTIAVHFYRELHLGNVNVILLFLALASLIQLTNNKKTLPGLLIGIVVLFKPQFLILLPLLGLYRYWYTALIALAVIAAGLLLPAIPLGFSGNGALLRQWFAAMSSHNAASELMRAPNAINHWIAPVLPVHGPHIQSAITALCLCLIFGAILFIQIREKKVSGPQTFFPLAFCALIAFIPNITVTDTEHFLFCLPLIGYLLMLFPQQRAVFKVATIIALVAYGCNWHDVWGHSISVMLENAGVLGLGNLAIIVLAFVSYFIFNSRLSISYFNKTKASR